MSRYRRVRLDGGTFFFTLTLADRTSDALVHYIDALRTAYCWVEQHHPFETIAICILPDHIHAVWELPVGDADYPTRWSLIKSRFSRTLPRAGSRSQSKIAKRDKGIWQRGYWEHTIRSETDLERHIDYIHFNPVKHGIVTRVCDWPYSSFRRYVARDVLPSDWGGNVRVASGSFGE